MVKYCYLWFMLLGHSVNIGVEQLLKDDIPLACFKNCRDRQTDRQTFIHHPITVFMLQNVDIVTYEINVLKGMHKYMYTYFSLILIRYSYCKKEKNLLDVPQNRRWNKRRHKKSWQSINLENLQKCIRLLFVI